MILGMIRSGRSRWLIVFPVFLIQIVLVYICRLENTLWYHYYKQVDELAAQCTNQIGGL